MPVPTGSLASLNYKTPSKDLSRSIHNSYIIKSGARKILLLDNDRFDQARDLQNKSAKKLQIFVAENNNKEFIKKSKSKPKDIELIHTRDALAFCKYLDEKESYALDFDTNNGWCDGLIDKLAKIAVDIKPKHLAINAQANRFRYNLNFYEYPIYDRITKSNHNPEVNGLLKNKSLDYIARIICALNYRFEVLKISINLEHVILAKSSVPSRLRESPTRMLSLIFSNISILQNGSGSLNLLGTSVTDLTDM